MEKKQIEALFREQSYEANIPDCKEAILAKYQEQAKNVSPSFLTVKSHRRALSYAFSFLAFLSMGLGVGMGVFSQQEKQEDRTPVLLNGNQEQIAYSILSTSSFLDISNHQSSERKARALSRGNHEASPAMMDSYLQLIHPYIPTVEAMLYENFSLSFEIYENDNPQFEEEYCLVVTQNGFGEESHIRKLYYSVLDISLLPEHYHPEGERKKQPPHGEPPFPLPSVYYIKGWLVDEFGKHRYEAFRMSETRKEGEELSFDSYTYLDEEEKSYIHIQRDVQQEEDGLFEMYFYEVIQNQRPISSVLMCFEKEMDQSMVYLSVREGFSFAPSSHADAKIFLEKDAHRLLFYSNLPRPFGTFYAEIVQEGEENYYLYYDEQHTFEKKLIRI